MTTFIKIGQNDSDTSYFLVKYELGCLSELPWEDELFDCLIFKSDTNDSMNKPLTNYLPKTTGMDSESWHDYIDQKSVDIGRQAAIGDGNPMTAWHEKMSTPEKWETSINFGGSR